MLPITFSTAVEQDTRTAIGRTRSPEEQRVLQGHALFTRQAGGHYPCPLVDFTGGFNKFMAAAYGLGSNETVESKYGKPFGALPACTRLC